MTKAVEIINSKGFVLRGFLTIPDDAEKIVVMFHGFTGNKTEHNGHFRNLSRLLEKENIASLRMDFHGNGESDGEFSDFDFDVALDDAKRMIEYSKSIKKIKKVVVLGFSMGGAIASLVTNDSNADELVLISPAGSMVEIATNRFNNSIKLDNGNAYFSGFEMSEVFVNTISKYDMYQNVKNFTKRVLVVCGRNDLSVPYVYGVRYASSYKNAHLHIIDNCGHGYDSYENMQELYSKTLNFLK